MSVYKLIKTYPGSLPINSVVKKFQEQDSHYHSDGVVVTMIHRSQVENQPEYWAPVIEIKEVVISDVSLKYFDGVLHYNKMSIGLEELEKFLENFAKVSENILFLDQTTFYFFDAPWSLFDIHLMIAFLKEQKHLEEFKIRETNFCKKYIAGCDPYKSKSPIIFTKVPDNIQKEKYEAAHSLQKQREEAAKNITSFSIGRRLFWVNIPKNTITYNGVTISYKDLCVTPFQMTWFKDNTLTRKNKQDIFESFDAIVCK